MRKNLRLFVALCSLCCLVLVTAELTQQQRFLNRQTLAENLAQSPIIGFVPIAQPETLGQTGQQAIYFSQNGSFIIPATSQGFYGPVTVYLALNSHGQILAITADTGKESQALLKALPHWLLQFKNNQAIDALTGATKTSQAIKQSTHQALMYFKQHQKELWHAYQQALN